MSIKTFSLIINISFVALFTSFGAICFEVVNGTSQANVPLAWGFTVFFGLMLAVIKKIAQSCN
jgi:hypothetical protein